MAIVFQNTSTSTTVTVANADELFVLEGVTVGVSTGFAVRLSAGAFLTEVHNLGTLLGPEGIDVDTTSAVITNHGRIVAITDDAIDFSDQSGFTSTYTVINTGYISARSQLLDFNLGGSVSGGAVNLTLINSGEMIGQTADTAIVFPVEEMRVASITNSGLMEGSILSMPASTVGRLFNTGTILTTRIDARGEGTQSIVNHGTITGRDSPDLGTDVVLTGNGFDVVVNTGIITGGVSLGNGGDRYLGDGAAQVVGRVQGGAGDDTLSGGDNADQLAGGGDNDLLVGRGGDDALAGDDGDDRILGGAGNDEMAGGIGNDTMNGQDGDDSLAGDAGNDILVGGAGSDELRGGDDNDTMNGQDGEDILEGEAGNDILRGGNGDDALAGGEGFDLLTGGTGFDSFVFRALSETAAGATRDQILDFEQGVDLIVVAGLSPGVFEFRGTAAFAPSGNPELRLFETSTGSTIVQIDADGNGIAEAEIRVANVTGLTAEDFVL